MTKRLLASITMQENARYLIAFLSEEIRKTGYYAGLKEISHKTVKGSRELTNFQQSCTNEAFQYAAMLYPKLQGSNDSKDGYECISNSKYLRGDILTVRFASPVENINTKKSYRNKLYLRASTSEGRLFSAQEFNNSLNQIVEAHTLNEINTSIFYLGNTDRHCNGEAIPALYREYLNKNGFMTAEELVSGVEQFQVQYQIKDNFYNADELAGADHWHQVKGLRVWLLMRSECKDFKQNNTKTLRYGDQSMRLNKNDEAYLREVYHFYVAIRN